jgi:hypothetical protein
VFRCIRQFCGLMFCVDICFEFCASPTWGPCGSGPAQTLDIIVLDTPYGDLNDLSSSSYGLSLFQRWALILAKVQGLRQMGHRV